MELSHEATVLTAPDDTYARERTPRRRGSEPASRHDLVEDFAEGEEDGGYNTGRRRTGLRLTFHGGLPQSVRGRVAAGVVLLAILVVGWAAAEMARRLILHDERFVLSSGSAIITEGNRHLSRAQLLEVFGGDIERNVLRVSLSDRKAELEQIPWVRHATVIRLLPDHIRVAIEERTPVAFVRQSGHIGLVDADGVLLDMGSNSSRNSGYSFPVVTGLMSSDPLSVRAARMKIFAEFTNDLDGGGEKISPKLSEVDLSNPEDVKALIPDNGTDVLVHFGDRDYLDRYRKYQAHLGEWRAQYPKLASVDMRYERQVVLEMQPGTAVPTVGPVAEQTEASGAGSAAIQRSGTAKLHASPKDLIAGQGRSRAKARTRVPSRGARKAGHL